MIPSQSWLCVSLSLEDELALERQVRAVEQSPHREEIGKLCAALVRQNVIYGRIIQQATGYVAKLEMQQLLQEHSGRLGRPVGFWQPLRDRLLGPWGRWSGVDE